MEKQKNILVFGAAGFIATYLIDQLISRDYRITASDILPLDEAHYRDLDIPFIRVDITKSEDFAKIKGQYFDVVIHLAALQPANFDPKEFRDRDYISVNIVGTINILEFCKENKCPKIIYATSHRNTSGFWGNGKPIFEQDGRWIEFDNEYSMFSISESTAQDCVEYYRSRYGIQTFIFRLPPVYGYGPHLEIFKEGEPIKTGFQTFIDNAMACKPLEIWGDATTGRDIIYVKDVVAAYIKAIENNRAGGLYNITSNYRLTLREEVETIAKVFWGDDSSPIFIRKPEKKLTMGSFVYDNSKAKKELKWSPEYSFEALLIDYKKEKEKNKFGYLVEKRKKMFKKYNSN